MARRGRSRSGGGNNNAGENMGPREGPDAEVARRKHISPLMNRCGTVAPPCRNEPPTARPRQHGPTIPAGAGVNCWRTRSPPCGNKASAAAGMDRKLRRGSRRAYDRGAKGTTDAGRGEEARNRQRHPGRG